MADFLVPQGERADHRGHCSFGQRRGQSYHPVKEVRVFPKGGDQGNSAIKVNRNVCTAVLRSSWWVSLISTFWKYPDLFNWVIRLATALTEAAVPSMVSAFPFRDKEVSHRVSVRVTVPASASSNS